VLGNEDPMNLTDEQLAEVGDKLDASRDQFRALWRSDGDLTSLFKSDEIDLSDGGPGVAERIRDTGVPVEWVKPSEGALSWVCGLAIPADSENTDAAYGLINYQASPEAQAIRADGGYVVTNPAAMKLADPAARKTADPAILDGAIPETEPPNYDEWTRTFQEFQAG
jgi:spermidine/putrescine transport system substrate-binding protein